MKAISNCTAREPKALPRGCLESLPPLSASHVAHLGFVEVLWRAARFVEWIWGSRKTRVCGHLGRVVLLWCFDPFWKAEGFQLQAKSLPCGKILWISEGRCVLVVFQSSLCSFLGRLEMLDVKATRQKVERVLFSHLFFSPKYRKDRQVGLTHTHKVKWSLKLTLN